MDLLTMNQFRPNPLKAISSTMVFQEHNKSHNPKKQSLKGHFVRQLRKSFFIPQKSTQKIPNISHWHFPPGRDHLFDIKNYKQIHQHNAINMVPVQVTPRFGILALSICFTATLRQHVEEWRCDKLQIELSFPQKHGKKKYICKY